MNAEKINKMNRR